AIDEVVKSKLCKFPKTAEPQALEQARHIFLVNEARTVWLRNLQEIHAHCLKVANPCRFDNARQAYLVAVLNQVPDMNKGFHGFDLQEPLVRYISWVLRGCRQGGRDEPRFPAFFLITIVTEVRTRQQLPPFVGKGENAFFGQRQISKLPEEAWPVKQWLP